MEKVKTTNNHLQEYIKNNYMINFEYQKDIDQLTYKKNKKEYSLSCGEALHPELIPGEYYWSIFYDFMDKKEWSGYGGSYVDEGNKTIDEIMQKWGFVKQQQTSIDDFIGE